MKHVTTKLFALSLLFSTSVYAKDVTHQSFLMNPLSGRTTSNGLIQQANHCCKDADTLSAHFSVGMEYAKSTKNDEIATFLFGKKELTFGAHHGADTDIFSTNFFLPENHTSTVTINPKLWSFTTDLRLHVALDEFVEGLSFNVALPIVHAKWDLGLVSSDVVAGNPEITEGRIGIDTPGNFPYADPVAALKGDKAGAVAGIDSKLKYGKIDGAQDDTKIADVRLALGYNLVSQDNAHLTLAALGIVNGDHVSKAEYLNTPTFGLGGRHAVGLRAEGSLRLWENNTTDLTAHVRADGAYAFKTTVTRSFDIKNHGPLSRYLLVAKHTDFNTVSAVTNAVNITTLEAKIGDFGVYDVNLMLSLTHGCWEGNIGYNMSGMSTEKFDKFVGKVAENYVVFNVGANMDGGNANQQDSFSIDIHIDGSNGTKGTAATDDTLDDGELATYSLSNDSLETKYALQPRTMAHTVFGSVGYCYDKNEWMPSVTFGGSYSLANDNRTVRQWSVNGSFGICF